ncbi:MAG: endonuclease [Elusimicrobiota bacterium]
MNIVIRLLNSAVIAALLVSPLKAQLSPALDSLQGAASVSLSDIEIPAAGEPYSAAAPMELRGEALFNYLHRSARPSQWQKAVIGYTEAKAYMYSTVDNVGCNGGPGIITFYSQVCVSGSSDNGNHYPERGDMNGDGVVDGFINAEHIWPQGYFKEAYPMKSDLHHLSPTFTTPNSRRGNLPFAEVADPYYSTSAGSRLGREGFEPADAVKGNVARAMLYFVTMYHDKNIRQGMNYANFWTSRVPMFLEWNRQDPPDAAERRRNDLIAAFQGARNPYIDDPSLADRIGAQVLASY